MTNTATTTIIKNDTRVTFKGVEGFEVLDYNKGWYLIAKIDGGEAVKARGKDLVVAEEPKQPKGESVIDPAYKRRVGNKNVGDFVALELEDLDIDQIHAIAARVFNTSTKAMYGHLNVGMQRMNVGNKLRAALKREEDSKKGPALREEQLAELIALVKQLDTEQQAEAA